MKLLLVCVLLLHLSLGKVESDEDDWKNKFGIISRAELTTDEAMNCLSNASHNCQDVQITNCHTFRKADACLLEQPETFPDQSCNNDAVKDIRNTGEWLMWKLSKECQVPEVGAAGNGGTGAVRPRCLYFLTILSSLISVIWM